jgi:Fe-S-cluster containining protein
VKEILRFDYPRKLRFQCGRCGKCCGDTNQRIRTVLLLRNEAERIAKATNLGFEDFLIDVSNSGPYRYSMRKDDLGKCCFLNGDSCVIYEIRPLVCRFYPFELEEIEEGRHVFTCTNECPCIGRGPKLRRAYFEKLFMKSLTTFREETENKQDAKQ